VVAGSPGIGVAGGSKPSPFGSSFAGAAAGRREARTTTVCAECDWFDKTGASNQYKPLQDAVLCAAKAVFRVSSLID